MKINLLNRSLYTKLVLIMLLLILSLTTVVGAFLVTEIRAFYLEDFYTQMKSVFESEDFQEVLLNAGEYDDVASELDNWVRARSGQLGLDPRARNYYILDGATGAVIPGHSSGTEQQLPMTANILTAITGAVGDSSNRSATYMDVAIPVSSSEEGYDCIVYVVDNKSAVYSLSRSLFTIIAEAMLVGLGISVVLSLLLAKTLVTPISQLTRAAEKVAAGDFTQKPESDSSDELGVLTRTFNDMASQLERNLDELRRSENMRREFVANVSHELRTPITSIRTYAETLIEAQNITDERRRDFLGVILNESDRMTNLVKDLLILSRFDAGSFELTFERFSIEKSIRDVYNATLLEAERLGHSFTAEIAQPLPEIVGDRSRLEQVLLNLVSNAIKYTRDGGRIEISAEAAGGFVNISVKDNGIGIPEEDLPKIFERFYRVDKARSRQFGGTGLGLAIVQEIVNRHNGKIEVRSRLGEGTEVVVALPVGGLADGQ
ncbi:MAG: cell wall metabolism sensor histidine kinase WalK [Oscillospiraceae bacterium]|jgi:signal transduction histidine kinase|nr:cell wall metabolism sensor histidine kinase WalK [Oscillospiraceae bacterium]